MKSIFFFLIQAFILSGAFASVEIKWELKNLPEMTYLYREHGIAFGNEKENTESNQKSLDTVKELIHEAKTRKLHFIKPAFFRFDLRAGKVLEVGLEIKEKRTAKAKFRASGKYLEARYEGSLNFIGNVFHQLPEKLKSDGHILLRDEAYYQKETGGQKNSQLFTILFPLKEK
ncbi:MAG: hypothetical protein V4598_12880 [Bdellovibrionota bacterium]